METLRGIFLASRSYFLAFVFFPCKNFSKDFLYESDTTLESGGAHEGGSVVQQSIANLQVEGYEAELERLQPTGHPVVP